VTEKLSQVACGKVRRLIITLPPRTLKSLCASVALPAWFLGRYPSERVVVVSYSDILARTHANDFRLLVNDPIYQAIFPAMRLARDTDREIMTTKRGKRIATSIDGTLTGLGGNLIIIDDPLKLGDAMSEAVRSRVIEWYRSTLLSRADDKTVARIVLVMQRVHQGDLAGYLQEQGGFEVLNLPAIAQRNETYFLGDGRTYDRQKGELLHPEHEPAHVLAELKREMGPIAFSAQYQQSPIPPGGTIIKRKWLVPYDNVDHQPGDRIVLSWDIALSEAETGDYSACVVMLIRGEVFYILEVVRGRFPFDALKRKVMEVKQRYGSATLLIEDSPISRGLIQSLSEKSINVTPYKPETDKRARVIAQSDLFAGGSVRFPRRAGWLEEFTAELLAFPGRHDDQVDALTQALAWGRHMWSRKASTSILQQVY
jgi:predicted phage terminase large subunit-like protein